MQEIIVALDVSEPQDALDIIRKIGTQAFYKIGHQLFSSRYRHVVFDELRYSRIFLDLKLYDVETTIENTIKNMVKNYEPVYISVHDVGVHYAINTLFNLNYPTRTKIIEVRNLTSQSSFEVFHSEAHGLICSPKFAQIMREMNPHAAIICPGLRLPEKTKTSSVFAHKQGSSFVPSAASYFVIGRPIILDSDPKAQYEKYTMFVNSEK